MKERFYAKKWSSLMCTFTSTVRPLILWKSGRLDFPRISIVPLTVQQNTWRPKGPFLASLKDFHCMCHIPPTCMAQDPSWKPLKEPRTLLFEGVLAVKTTSKAECSQKESKKQIWPLKLVLQDQTFQFLQNTKKISWIGSPQLDGWNMDPEIPKKYAPCHRLAAVLERAACQ